MLSMLPQCKIAAVSAPSVACSMLAVHQQKRLLSPIRRRVRGTTRLPHDEAHSVDRPGILATDVRRSEIYSGVCSRSDLWTSKHSLYWILSVTGNQCNSRRAGVTRLEIHNRNQCCIVVHDTIAQMENGVTIWSISPLQRNPQVLAKPTHCTWCCDGHHQQEETAASAGRRYVSHSL